MCTTCGCGTDQVTISSEPRADHDHGDHHHTHTHHHPTDAHLLTVEQDLLSKNNQFADSNRRLLAARGVFAVNLVSSPGSGKTTLLVKTASALKDELPLAVVEGDQQTSQDVQRIRAVGVPAIQINTGKGCHLDAHMVGHALEHLELEKNSVLFIENVGNLVCPAAFDLGEAHKIVIISVTEGEDKPLKYPDMFAAADLMLVNKIDLLPHVDFDVARCIQYATRVNPAISVLQLSATSGEGLVAWLEWVGSGHRTASIGSEPSETPLRLLKSPDEKGAHPKSDRQPKCLGS